MTYNSKYNKQHYEYRSGKYKRVGLDIEKEYYDNVLKPAADSLDMPVGTFIKKVLEKEITRMQKKKKA